MHRRDINLAARLAGRCCCARPSRWCFFFFRFRAFVFPALSLPLPAAAIRTRQVAPRHSRAVVVLTFSSLFLGGANVQQRRPRHRRLQRTGAGEGNANLPRFQLECNLACTRRMYPCLHSKNIDSNHQAPFLRGTFLYPPAILCISHVNLHTKRRSSLACPQEEVGEDQPNQSTPSLTEVASPGSRYRAAHCSGGVAPTL